MAESHLLREAIASAIMKVLKERGSEVVNEALSEAWSPGATVEVEVMAQPSPKQILLKMRRTDTDKKPWVSRYWHYYTIDVKENLG